MKTIKRVVLQVLLAICAGVGILIVIAVISHMALGLENPLTFTDIKANVGFPFGRWLIISLAIDALLTQSVFRNTSPWRKNWPTFFVMSVGVTVAGILLAIFLSTLFPNLSISTLFSNLSITEAIQRGERVFTDVFGREKVINVLFSYLVFFATTTTCGLFVWEEETLGTRGVKN